MEEMERYLNREREAFQKEVEDRNSKIQEISNTWEREKDVSAAMMQQKVELSR